MFATLLSSVAAGILLWSGTSKLVSSTALSRSLRELGLSRGLALRVPRLLACFEIVTAASLAVSQAVIASSPRLIAAAAVCAIGLLILAASVRAQLIGAKEPCGCFGSNSAEPIGMVSSAFGFLLLSTAVAIMISQAPSPSSPSVWAIFAACALAIAIELVGQRRFVVWQMRRLSPSGRPLSAVGPAAPATATPMSPSSAAELGERQAEGVWRQ